MWVGTFTVESGTGGLPSDPFPDRCSPLYGSIEARCAASRARGAQARWATSLVDSMNGRFRAPWGGLTTAVAGDAWVRLRSISDAAI